MNMAYISVCSDPVLYSSNCVLTTCICFIGYVFLHWAFYIFVKLIVNYIIIVITIMENISTILVPGELVFSVN